MPHVGKHALGDFCWLELATTDQSAAKEFYSEPVGWTIGEFPMGPKDFYTTFKIDGRDVAAAYTFVQNSRREGSGALESLCCGRERGHCRRPRKVTGRESDCGAVRCA